MAFCIEKYGFAKYYLNQSFGFILIITNLLMAFGILLVVVLINDCHAFGAHYVCLVYSSLIFKLISYHIVNYWFRNKKISIENGETKSVNHNKIDSDDLHKRKNVEYIQDANQKPHDDDKDSRNQIVCYPNNLNLNDMYYFIFAPTLCYQLNYPRNKSIRKGFLINFFLEFVSYFISNQRHLF